RTSLGWKWSEVQILSPRPILHVASAIEQLEQALELGAQRRELLLLGLRLLGRQDAMRDRDRRAGHLLQPLARAADGEALVVEQAADAPDHLHILRLVVAAVAAPLHRSQLGEFLLPVAQHVRLDGAQLADLADREVALVRDVRQLRRLIRCFPHRSPLSSAVSARGGMSPRAAQKWESLRRSWDCGRAAGSCRAARNCRSPRASPALPTPGSRESPRRTDRQSPLPRACSSQAARTAPRPAPLWSTPPSRPLRPKCRAKLPFKARHHGLHGRVNLHVCKGARIILKNQAQSQTFETSA